MDRSPRRHAGPAAVQHQQGRQDNVTAPEQRGHPADTEAARRAGGDTVLHAAGSAADVPHERPAIATSRHRDDDPDVAGRRGIDTRRFLNGGDPYSGRLWREPPSEIRGPSCAGSTLPGHGRQSTRQVAPSTTHTTAETPCPATASPAHATTTAAAANAWPRCVVPAGLPRRGGPPARRVASERPSWGSTGSLP